MFAKKLNKPVKAFGAGHSPSDLACTEGFMINIDKLKFPPFGLSTIKTVVPLFGIVDVTPASCEIGEAGPVVNTAAFRH